MNTLEPVAYLDLSTEVLTEPVDERADGSLLSVPFGDETVLVGLVVELDVGPFRIHTERLH